MAQRSGSGKLEVHVVTPEQEVWTGEADFVVVTAIDGELGVLPGHAPLLAALDVGRMKIVTGGSEELAAVEGGFLHVANDRVDILAERAEMGGDVEEFREQRRQKEEEEEAEQNDG